jgi:uncharacterized protein (DUF305 family)
LLAAIAAASIALAGCAGLGMPEGRYGANAPVRSATVGDYTTQELMFASMMIPHHEQAVDMSDLVLAQSTHPEIRALALAIKAGQEPEITQMKRWLDSSPSITAPGREPSYMDHGDMEHGDMGNAMAMSGMASPEQMAELARAVSPQADELFLRLMIDHHEGALLMVSMIRDSSNPEVRTLATDITRVQSEEIATMRLLLQDLLKP